MELLLIFLGALAIVALCARLHQSLVSISPGFSPCIIEITKGWYLESWKGRCYIEGKPNVCPISTPDQSEALIFRSEQDVEASIQALRQWDYRYVKLIPVRTFGIDRRY